MNASLRLAAAFAAVAATSFFAHAQVVSDDFSSATNWSSSVAPLGGTSAIQISGGQADFVVASPQDNDVALIGYLPAFANYGDSWKVQIDIHYAHPTSVFGGPPLQHAINLGVGVIRNGYPFGVVGDAPTHFSYGASFNLFHDGGMGFTSEFRGTYTNPAADPGLQWIDGEPTPPSAVSGATVSTIQISFCDGTLSAGYDADGAANGYSFVSLGLDMAPGEVWDMTSGESFSVYLVANSLFDGEEEGIGPVIASGAAYFDNFSATGLTSVPEPSAYAAGIGLAVLGVGALRRRRAHA